MSFNFLELIVSRIPPDFFGMMATGPAYRDVECCMRPAARYSFRIVSIGLTTRGFTRLGREVTGGLPGGTEISNGRREYEPKVSYQRHVDKDVSQQVYDVWVPTRTLEIE